MRTISTTVEIEAPAERVWAVLTDFARYPEWNPFIVGWTGELRPGARVHVTLHPPGGRPARFRPTVLVVETNREIRWRGRLGVAGLFDGEHRFEIVDGGQGSVQFVQSEGFTGLLVPLLRGVIGRAAQGFALMNSALKSHAERTTP